MVCSVISYTVSIPVIFSRVRFFHQVYLKFHITASHILWQSDKAVQLQIPFASLKSSPGRLIEKTIQINQPLFFIQN